MIFGRSDEAFWTMTPAQVHVLLSQHRRVHDPKGRGRGQTEPGTVSDLLMFQTMRRV